MEVTDIDGAERYLIRRYLVKRNDILEGLPVEALRSVSEVHRAERIGMPGVIGVDLLPHQAQKIERLPSLVDLTNISRLSLGLDNEEPDLTSDLDAESWMSELPDVRDPGEIGCVEDVPRAYTTQTNQTVRTSRFWKVGPTLDQNGEYSSLAFSLVHHLNALPRRNAYDGEYAAKLHNKIVSSNGGTLTMDAGMRALRSMGHVNQFRYALTLDSIRKWLLYRGGVSLGFDCYEGMLMPDSQGFVRPTGRRLGRVAVFCRGVSPWGSLRLQYSYGEGFCHRGMAWLSRADVSWMIKTDSCFRAVCWRESRQC